MVMVNVCPNLEDEPEELGLKWHTLGRLSHCKNSLESKCKEYHLDFTLSIRTALNVSTKKAITSHLPKQTVEVASCELFWSACISSCRTTLNVLFNAPFLKRCFLFFPAKLDSSADCALTRRITPSSAKICKYHNFSAVLFWAVYDVLNPNHKQLTPAVNLSCIYAAELKNTGTTDTHPEAVWGGIHVPVPALHKPCYLGKQSWL